MFTIYTKTIGLRSFDMYFENFAKAEKWLLKDIDDCKAIGCTVTGKNIGVNHDKGIGIYNYFGRTPAGEVITWSLSEGYFSDHLTE